MRLWMYLLPAGLWLWFARRYCERVTHHGVLVINAGRGNLLVAPPTPR